MKKYNKKEVSRENVLSLVKKFNISALEASIFIRRGITSGQDLMYYLENDRRFMHLPFEFNNMEDAVSRITDAVEEGEKVLIFGDKDVDGITSTAILYGYLKGLGLDVQWRLPVGDDAYGLSMDAVDNFAKEYGTLIITVDCGISNNTEIAHARELGIDVIVTDHHNPPENLPCATLFLDPKMPDSGYPFKDISGAAVAFKLVQALRFSKTDLYAQDISLLDVQKLPDGNFEISIIKTRNLVKKECWTKIFEPGFGSISNTKLPDILRGQQIFCWNSKIISSYLKEIFGTGVEFQMLDMQAEISRLIPSVNGKTLSQLTNISKIAKYSETEIKEIESFYNIFVTFVELSCSKYFPQHDTDALQDLQLVGIAALADIMPMQNENRIFVKNALSAINGGKTRKGIAELIARMDLAGKSLTSTDLSWKLIPALNASGRMGQSNVSLELLLAESSSERNALAEKIIDLNEDRKRFVQDGEMYTSKQAEENYAKFNGKMCVVADQKINRGVTGILAAKIMNKYNVPSIAITFSEDGKIAVGSMRSCRSIVATKFLDSFGSDFFINHGGHDAAAGFSFTMDKMQEFLKKAWLLSRDFNLDDEEDTVEIDAELPGEYITPDLLNLVDKFEPYGEKNKELVFVSSELKIHEGIPVGKSEIQSLKLIFDCGKYKFPAMFWGQAERLNRDFKVGDKLSVLYSINRNTYKGNVTPQMILIDADNKM